MVNFIFMCILPNFFKKNLKIKNLKFFFAFFFKFFFKKQIILV